jgi:hypothetical protein
MEFKKCFISDANFGDLREEDVKKAFSAGAKGLPSHEGMCQSSEQEIKDYLAKFCSNVSFKV